MVISGSVARTGVTGVRYPSGCRRLGRARSRETGCGRFPGSWCSSTATRVLRSSVIFAPELDAGQGAGLDLGDEAPHPLGLGAQQREAELGLDGEEAGHVLRVAR